MRKREREFLVCGISGPGVSPFWLPDRSINISLLYHGETMRIFKKGTLSGLYLSRAAACHEHGRERLGAGQ
jgi:hypothetical protein